MRSEHHLSVTLFADASQGAYTAVFLRDSASQQIRDYWLDHERDINILGTRALYNALISFFALNRNAQVDVWTDNVTLEAAWEIGCCRNLLVIQEMKTVEEMSCAGNFAIHFKYIPSTENVADAPSRALSDITVICPRLRRLEFSRISARTRLILCL